jgi:2-polyprenyl-3-methyl-5-hydroxy-6-metoxy-1,4-benzoquinol methylase
MKHIYEIKGPEYFSSTRREILPLLPEKSGRVLELGCGQGATISWLKQLGRVEESWGIELMESAAAVASGIVDHLIVGDIEDGSVEFEPGKFDLILCLDVLEHLKDPWAVMAALGGWLRNGGVLIASLPNIRYYTILRDLAFHGSFQYQDFGLLDRTHLRFFTRKSAIELMKSGGLDHIQVLLHPDRVAGRRMLINFATLGFFRDVFSWQLLLRGQKILLP